MPILKYFTLLIAYVGHASNAFSLLSNIKITRTTHGRGNSLESNARKQLNILPQDRQNNLAFHTCTINQRNTGALNAGPSVLEAPSELKKSSSSPSKERKSVGSEAWEVRIYNDGLNTREHVARCLVQITGLAEITAYQTMMQAHQNGIAVVGRWIYERAEMYRDALKKSGILCDMVPVDED